MAADLTPDAHTPATSETRACSHENRSPRAQKVEDGLVIGVEQILDVKYKIRGLDARPADAQRDVGAEISSRVRRGHYRHRRKRPEVAISTIPDVQHAKVEPRVLAEIGAAKVPCRRRPTNELLIGVI